jgi:hypothetical protein
MDWFSNILRTFGPRAAAAGAAIAADKIARSTGVVVDPATLTGLALAVYAAVHKGISAKVNPGDAANGRVASAEKVAADNGSTVVVKASK